MVNVLLRKRVQSSILISHLSAPATTPVG